MREFVLGVRTLSTLALAVVVEASTLRVPDDYPSVLVAVDAAAEGDTVLVGAGTWTHREDRWVEIDGFLFLISGSAFPRHGMTIRGEGANVTTIDGSGGGDGEQDIIVFAEPEGAEPLVIEDLSLRGVVDPARDAAAVGSIRSPGVVVRSCRFADNISGGSGGVGAAVAARDCSVEIIDSEIVDCTSPGGAVWLVRGALDVQNCRFERVVGKCIQADFDGDPTPGPVRVEDCVFVDNRGAGYGVCLDLYYAPDVAVARNLFLRNAAEEGGGGGLRTTVCTATIEFNTFAYDSTLVSGSRGGAIRSETSDLTVRNNTFVGSYSRLGGAAFSAAFGGSVVFEHNVTTYSAGAEAVNAAVGVTIIGNQCNLFWANAAGDYGNWTPSPSDFDVDPLFCNHLAGDWTVQSNSPCATLWCAPLGALGVACDTVSIDPMSWGRTKAAFRTP